MTETVEYLEPALVAANWWADQIKSPTHDNGDPSLVGAMATVLAGQLANSHRVTDEQVQIFTHELASDLTSRLTIDSNREHTIFIMTDYGPDLTLSTAAKIAEIDPSVFPWKTKCQVSKEYVLVATGYGAQWRCIWKEKSFELGVCDKRNYLEDRATNQVCKKEQWHEGGCGEWFTDTSICAECNLDYPGHDDLVCDYNSPYHSFTKKDE